MSTSPRTVVRTAVLPVAGLGTRFLPVTKAVPKEMLPLVDRPCIDYAIAEAVAAGIERVVLVTSPAKAALSRYYEPSPDLEAHLRANGKDDLLARVQAIGKDVEVITVIQEHALGLGHAVLTAKDVVDDDAFAVLLADDVVDADTPAIGQLIDDWEERHAVVALMEVPPADTQKYGVCAGLWREPDLMEVHAMVEKPAPEDAPSNHAIVGRYVLPTEIFSILERTGEGSGGEIQLTDALATLAARGLVFGKVFDGRRFDTGNVLGFLEATLHYTRKRPDLRAGLDEILARL